MFVDGKKAMNYFYLAMNYARNNANLRPKLYPWYSSGFTTIPVVELANCFQEKFMPGTVNLDKS